jgi:hypothetical protein
MTKHQDRPHSLSPDRACIVHWAASVGAVTAEALAHLHGASVESARGRLSIATRQGLLVRHRLLTRLPTLYTVTRAGLRAAGIERVQPCRISAANALHTTVCVHAAAELQRRYPDQCIVGERELLREERGNGARTVSTKVRRLDGRGPALHSPDLVLWAAAGDGGRPTAVEIELTIKAPRRLEHICRAWARSRDVGGVVYLAPGDVERALHRAIERAHAGDRIVVLPLDALPLAAAITRLGF